MFCEFLDKLFDTNQIAYQKIYIIPMVHQFVYQDLHNSLMVAGVIMQSLFYSGQETIFCLFPLVKMLL